MKTLFLPSKRFFNNLADILMFLSSAVIGNVLPRLAQQNILLAALALVVWIALSYRFLVLDSRPVPFHQQPTFIRRQATAIAAAWVAGLALYGMEYANLSESPWWWLLGNFLHLLMFGCIVVGLRAHTTAQRILPS